MIIRLYTTISFKHREYENRRTWEAVSPLKENKYARQQQVPDVYPQELRTYTASAQDAAVAVQFCSRHPDCWLNPTLRAPAISGQWTHPQFFPHLASTSISHRTSSISCCTKLTNCDDFFLLLLSAFPPVLLG